MKPNLTEEQKQSFEKKFRELLTQAPEELLKQWDGQIYWIQDMPNTSVASKLNGRLADKYVALINSIKSRTI